MSLRIRLTIPDGALCDHLSGLSRSGAAFELIRLATNGLQGVRHYENQSNDKGMVVDTFSNEEKKKPEYRETHPKKPSKKEIVEFGDDLLEL